VAADLIEAIEDPPQVPVWDPGSVSLTRSTAQAAPPAFPSRTRMVPPSGVNFAALDSRFDVTSRLVGRIDTCGV
jgi:hypothetical protein